MSILCGIAVVQPMFRVDLLLVCVLVSPLLNTNYEAFPFELTLVQWLDYRLSESIKLGGFVFN